MLDVLLVSFTCLFTLSFALLYFTPIAWADLLTSLGNDIRVFDPLGFTVTLPVLA